ATVKTQETENEWLSSGANGSLLQTAWPALTADFHTQWRQAPAVPRSAPADSSAAGPPSSSASAGKVLKLRRLPRDWTPFAGEVATSIVAIPPETLSSAGSQ